ncbi:MAG: hypothetical protein WC943_10330, partial [Elusimicrobiota bacterium]
MKRMFSGMARTIRGLEPLRALRILLVLALLNPLPYSGVGVTSARAASVPSLMNFQGRLTDNLNNPLAGPHDFVFRIFDASSGGTQLWTETRNGVTVLNGVLAVQLGAANPLTPAVFYTDNAYLEIDVDGETRSPRERLITSPYAFGAKLLDGRSYDAFVSTDASAQTILGAKTFSGTVFVPAPTADTHAATKKYVDDQVVGGGTGWIKDGSVVKLVASGDNVVVQSTLTVQGNAFSVGVSSLAIKDGRVGIRTSNPGYALEVNGTALASDFLIIDGSASLSKDGNYVRLHGTNGVKLTVWDSGQVNALTVAPVSGDVGIGTTSPQQRLHVSSGNAVVDFGIRTSTLTFAAGLTADPVPASGMLYYNASTNKLRLYNGSWADVATGASGSFVSKTGDSMTGQLTIRGATVDVSSFTSQGAVGIGGVGLGNGTLVVKSTSTDATNPVVNLQANNGSELMRVQQNGRVGIGTTAPGQALEVNGDVKATQARIGSTYMLKDNGSGIALVDQATGVSLQSFLAGPGYFGGGLRAFNLRGLDDTYDLNIYTTDATSGQLYLHKTGNVGVGTTSPASKLHISSGTLLLNGDASTAFKVGVSSFIINSTGNVGVGTTDPKGLLHVTGTLIVGDTNPEAAKTMSVVGPAEFARSAGAWNSGDTVLEIAHDANFSNILARSSGKGVTIQGKTGGGVNQTGITVDQNGKVSIGATSPQEKLHVSSGSAVVDFGIRTSTLTFAAGLTADPTAAPGMIYYNASTNKLRLYNGSWADVATGASGSFVSKTGDSMTGQLTMWNSTITIAGASGNAFSVGVSTLAVKDGKVGIGNTTAGARLSVTQKGADVEYGTNGEAIYINQETTPYVSYGFAFNVDAAASGNIIRASTLFSVGNSNNTFGDDWNTGYQLNALGVTNRITNHTADKIPLGIWRKAGSATPYFGVTSSAWRSNSDADVFIIDGSGNVGIGSSNPAEKLVVSGGSIKTSYGVISSTHVFTPQASAPATAANGMVYYDNGTNKLRLYNGAWADVATGASGDFVSKTGDSMTGQLTLRGASVGVSSFSALGAVGIGGIGLSAGTLVVKSTSTDATNPVVNIQANNGTELMRVQQDGKVGIGTSNPGYPLQVEGILYGNGDIRSGLFKRLDGTRAFLSTTGNDMILGADNAGNAQFVNAFFNITGNLGVGTLSPQEKLHVSSGNAVVDFGIRTSTLVFAAGLTADPVPASGMLYYNSSSGKLRYYNGAWNELGVAGAGYSTIQEESAGLTQRTSLNFIGAGITATDNAGNTRTDITLDADLDDLADGTLTGSKVGSGIAPGNLSAGALGAGVRILPEGVDLSTVTTRINDLYTTKLSTGVGVPPALVDLSTVTSAISGFVVKTGDSMTGQLTIRGASVGVSSFSALGAVGIGGIGLSGGTLVVKSTSTDATNPVVNIQANNGTELMRVQQNGNVWIGKDAYLAGPVSKLHIHGTTAGFEDLLTLTNGDGQANRGASLGLGIENNGPKAWLQGGFFDPAGGFADPTAQGKIPGLNIKVWDPAAFIRDIAHFTAVGNNILRISMLPNANGRMGIGTYQPSHMMDVNGGAIFRSSVTLAGLSSTPNTEAGRGAIYFDSDDNKFKVSENNGAFVDLVTAGGTYVAKTGDSMTGPLTMWNSTITISGEQGNAFSVGVTTFVVKDGRIGLGTTNPAYRLDTTGAIRQQYYSGSVWRDFLIGSGYELDGTAHGSGGYKFYTRWGDSGYGAGGWPLIFGTAANPTVTFVNSGVYIGDTYSAPTWVKLQSAGSSDSTLSQTLLRLYGPTHAAVAEARAADFNLRRWNTGDTFAHTALDFRLAENNGYNPGPDATVLTLLSSGDVGISTGTPQARLHVSSGSAIVDFGIRTSTLTFAAGLTADPTAAPGMLYYNSSSGKLKYYNGAWNELGVAGAGYSTIQEESAGLAQQTSLNFLGTGFTATNDAGNSRTNITLDADLDDLADGTLSGSKVGSGIAAGNISAGALVSGVRITPEGVDLSTVTARINDLYTVKLSTGVGIPPALVDLSTVTSAISGFVVKTGDSMTGQLSIRGASVGVSSITTLGAVGIGGVGLSAGTLVVKSTSTDATNPVVNIQANNASELLRVQQDGMVGIGTTNPGSLLSVGTNNAFNVSSSGLMTVTNDVGNVELQFTGEFGSNIYSQSSMYFRVDSDNDSSESFGFINGADTTLLRIQEDGNIGISTTEPSEKLHVKGNILADYGVKAGTVTWTPGTEPVTPAEGMVYYNNADDQLKLRLAASWVSIATGAIPSGGNFVAKTGDSMTGQLTIGGSSLTVRSNAASSPLLVSTSATPGVAAIYVDDSNNVGIGTTNPGSPIAVYDPYGALFAVKRRNTVAQLLINGNTADSGARISMETGRYGIYNIYQW